MVDDVICQGKFCQSLSSTTRTDMVKILTLFVKEGGFEMKETPTNVTMDFMKRVDFFRFLPMWFMLPMTKDTMDTDLQKMADAFDGALANATSSGWDIGTKEFTVPVMLRSMVKGLAGDNDRTVMADAWRTLQGTFNT